MSDSTRQGILAAGNFIIDHVKIVDEYPEPEMLANILSQSSSNGGGPYNLLKDLARLKAPFPLYAQGRIGADAEGDWILADCQAHGIDTALVERMPGTATSYTDAMTVAEGGQRTFFHHRGANALLDLDCFDFSNCSARLFYLGYFLLLDKLDLFDEGNRTGSSRVLERANNSGLLTCADSVSTNHPQFDAIIKSSLPFVDILFINEIEAEKTLGSSLRDGANALESRALIRAGEELLDLGVRQMVVLHVPEGAVVTHAREGCYRQGSVDLPAGDILGSTGAGDAFAAGFLYGVHERQSIAESLKLGVCAAAASLTHGAPSDGVGDVESCLAFESRYDFRQI